MAKDVIRTLLGLLGKADRDANRAAQTLGRLLGVPTEPTPLKDCDLSAGGQTYRGKLTPDQCQQLMKVGTSASAVRRQLRSMLKAVNGALATSRAQVLAALTPATKTAKALVPPPLGACNYSIGNQDECADGLTQTQCDTLNGMFSPGRTCPGPHGGKK
jgi:hypothetical protein